MKKIMFNTRYGLEQAVLDGRKTMTRRFAYYGDLEKPNVCYGLESKHKDNCVLYDWNKIIATSAYKVGEATSAYKVGEVVAIAQSYKDCLIDWRPLHLDKRAGWNNKMFVKANLMPHHIKITNIRVERLQDISDEDCLREGISRTFNGTYNFIVNKGNKKTVMLYDSPREAFSVLIDKVSGKGTWESNPYVFVYEFELVD